MRQARPAHGLGPASASLLSHLVRTGPLSPKELAAREGVQSQSLTRQLATLEERGIITRRPHAHDGRQVVVEITDAGRRLVEDDRLTRDQWLARAIAERLTPVERDVLAAANKLLDLLSET
ncbi:MarR family transcriptional regulator [Streptomyces sp. NPDC046261]|uniref:MarR family winged helix-turn-helix transcriptional regulator n=1 Tax=Streptomyces sp. NPDC046261 TaxID=3157200 RepID=UPI0033CA0C8A